MRPSRCTLFAAVWLATACAPTESRIIVAPDGSKALYVECKESPVECLAAISNECRGGYEVLAQGSRDETLMIDKVTEAGTQVAATRFAGQGAKGITATPSNIRQLLVRCGHGATAANDLQKLLDLPANPATPATSPKPAPTEKVTLHASADNDNDNDNDSDERVLHRCPGADATVRRQRASQWKNILNVQKAGASQPGISAELACNMARRLFLERCPEWSPYVPQVSREVCVIAETESKRAARLANTAAPAVESVNLDETP